MRRPAVLCVCVLAACGSSGSKAATPLSVVPTTSRPVDYCQMEKKAAIAASAAFRATTGKHPTTFTELVASDPPTLLLADASGGASLQSELISPKTVQNDDGWTLTMTGDGTRAPTFECS